MTHYWDEAARERIPVRTLVEQRDQARAEAERLRADVVLWLASIGEEYRRCIVAARATMDGHYYQTCNGRAEAYRQAASAIAGSLGLDAPDWDLIRREVPADGIYRDGVV